MDSMKKNSIEMKEIDFMKRKWQKRVFAGTLAVTMISSNIIGGIVNTNAGAAPDGSTNATDLAKIMQTESDWTAWQEKWNTVKNDWTQISLTPGSDASELNFAWYSKKPSASSDAVAAPKLKIGEKQDLSDAEEYTAVQTEVEKETDDKGNTYLSNKVTVKHLKADTTYYYSYEKDGVWTQAVTYKTQSPEAFSFIFVGDPQIGSSNELKGEDSEEFYTAQSEAVCSDAYNWSATLNAAMAKTENQASFVVSAGDQIQTTKKKAPNKDAAKSEIEYAGYLSPTILKSLPVATSVGNHDADNANYTYHFNTPNNSDLGSNDIVGGDYYFTYGSVLFMMLNTQDTNVAEHKQFMEEAIKVNPDCKWRVVTLHQDIYGSAEHSNEPEITNLRYQLTPYFEENDIDMVLTGHDHAYSRSKMLLGGTKTTDYTDDEFDEQLEKDMDAGENPGTLFTAPGNINEDTTDESEKNYLSYLKSVMDEDAIEQVKTESDAVINPDGILYMTANSSSGSKYYDLVPRMQNYIANRWQEDVPTYSIVNVDNDSLSISTYRTDNGEKIDEAFTIAKVTIDKTSLQSMVNEVQQNEVAAKDTYTAESYQAFEQALAGADSVLKDDKATNSEVAAAIKAITETKAALVKKAVEINNNNTNNTTNVVVKTNISTAAVEKISNRVYNGKQQKPSVKVTVMNTELKKGTDYTVGYTQNKNIGKATITITGIGNYEGTKKVAFYIVPKKAALKSVKAAGKKQIKVALKKSAGKITAYEIKYAGNRKFSKSKTIFTTRTALTIKSLASKKPYYVKVRAYKVVDGKKIYGAYSKVVKVKVK